MQGLRVNLTNGLDRAKENRRRRATHTHQSHRPARNPKGRSGSNHYLAGADRTLPAVVTGDLMACLGPTPATVELRLTAEHDPAPFWLGRTDPGAALGMGTHGTQR